MIKSNIEHYLQEEEKLETTDRFDALSMSAQLESRLGIFSCCVIFWPVLVVLAITICDANGNDQRQLSILPVFV